MIRITVVTFAVTFVAFAGLLMLLPTPPSSSTVVSDSVATDVVIENVRVFDGRVLHPPTTLVLASGKVLGFGDQIERPVGARVLDGSGKTALPGLIDAHTHSYGQARRDALRFGITTLFDMFTDPATIPGIGQSRASFEDTDTAALYSAGMLATVAGGHGTQFGVTVDALAGPEQAADWVAARKAEGSDYIKLAYIPGARNFPSLDLATARAVIDAAHAQELLAVAHISSQAAALELLDAGIDGFVHIFADEYVSEEFTKKARATNVFIIPTLSVIATADGRSISTQLMDDVRLQPFLNEQQKYALGTDVGGPHAGFSLDVAQHNVQRLHAAGIAMLAGSDAPNAGTAHGVTLHQEMWLLTQSGLTASEALAAATSTPAKLFSAAGRGVIEPGARADLILVDGDPSIDITATRAIVSVFRNGREVPRQADAPAVAGEPVPALLGDFEQGINAPPGFAWAPTTDSIMGGSSEAELGHANAGADGSAGALFVTATVYLDFAYPWAGAYLAVTPDGRTGDLSEYGVIEFYARGTPGSYRVMLFSTDLPGAPPTSTFAVTPRWTRVSLPLAGFSGFQRERFTGLAITTPMEAGRFAFEIDNVRLVK